MIAKQQLENSAKATGLDGEWSDTFTNSPKGGPMFIPFGGRGMWQPHLPTTQGKSDLMDLILALDISHRADGGLMECRLIGTAKFKFCEIIDDNKHAALAEAVVSVASQIWESKQ